MKKQFHFFSVSFVLIVLIGLLIYPESYSFWREAVSHLGGVYTIDEHIFNPLGAVFFSLGILFLTAQIFNIIRLYRKKVIVYWRKTKLAILWVMGIGGILTAIPHDVSVLHGIGAIMFLGGYAVYNFVCQLIKSDRDRILEKPISRIFDYTLAIAIIITVFIYAYYVTVSIMDGVSNPIHEDLIQENTTQKIFFFETIVSIFLLDEDDF